MFVFVISFHGIGQSRKIESQPTYQGLTVEKKYAQVHVWLFFYKLIIFAYDLKFCLCFSGNNLFLFCWFGFVYLCYVKNNAINTYTFTIGPTCSAQSTRAGVTRKAACSGRAAIAAK